MTEKRKHLFRLKIRPSNIRARARRRVLRSLGRTAIECLETRNLLASILFPNEQFEVGTSPRSIAVGDVNRDGLLDVVTANFYSNTSTDDSNSVSVLLGGSGGTFQTKQTFVASDGPIATVLKDVNGDDFLDVVTANIYSNDVSVLLGNGDGTFRTQRKFAAGDGPNSLAIGDVNGDGWLDILTTNSRSNNLSVLLGNGDSTFLPQQVFAVGNSPSSIRLGDINDDGHLDALTANYESDSISVLLSNGDGTFQAHETFASGDGPLSVTLGDVNGDQILDAITANANSNDVSVLLGNGDGTFPTQHLLATGIRSNSITLGDVNNDGHLDVLTANLSSNSISTLLGHGDGTFDTAQAFAAGKGATSITLGDMNGDGLLDVLTANSQSGTISLLFGNGTGTFETQPTFSAGARPAGIALGDTNGDGQLDAFVANYASDNVSILLGLGDGTFTTQAPIATRDGPRAVTSGDVNGDGRLDLLVANYDSNDISVILGEGDGTFHNQQTFNAGQGPISLTVGDFNGDGRLDLLTANYLSHDISLLLGEGNGTFSNQQTFAVGQRPFSVTCSDVNEDGNTDILTANHNSNDISVLLGNGDGSFQSQRTFAAGLRPASITVGDVNGDGRLDILTANYASDDISALLGNGDGTFEVQATFPAGNGATFVALADVNGDNQLDALSANFLDFNLSALLGNGDGTFQRQRQFATGNTPFAFAMGDINQDARIDVLTANYFGDSLSLLLNLTPVPPTLDAIADVVIDEDSSEQIVELHGITAGLGDSQSLRVAARSSDVGLLPHPSVTYTTANTSGTLTLTPVANQSGFTTITVTVEDGGLDNDLNTADDNLSFSRSFTVTVNSVNDLPTVDAIGSLIIDEDASQQTIPLTGITAGGGESQPLRVTATSSDIELLPIPAINYTSANTAGTLYFATIAERSGIATITVTVEDGGLDGNLATAGDNLTFSRSLTVTVNSVNDFPTLDIIRNIAIDEDASQQSVSVTGISAGGGEYQPLRVTASTLNADLIPNPAIDYTSANSYGTLTFTPVANQSGVATITVTVEDGGLDGDLNTADDNLTFSRSFTVTVDPINDSPTLDAISEEVLDEDAAQQTIALTGITAGGGESQPLRVIALSRNTELIPNPTVSYTSANTSGTLSFTPVTNQSGIATIDVNVEDGGLDGDLATADDNAIVTRSFTVTVISVNDQPTIAEISDVFCDLNGSEKVINLTDISAGGRESQPLRITASSSNTALIPNPSVNYTTANTTGTLAFTPVADQVGIATVTVTVEDGGLDGDLETANDNLTFSRSFVVTVKLINDPPTIDALSNLVVEEDAAQRSVELSGISAGGNESQPLRVTATSSDTALIANPSVSYQSANSSGTLFFTPAADRSGQATILVTVEDGGFDGDLATLDDNATFGRSFTVTVEAVNDGPRLNGVVPNVTYEANHLITVEFAADLFVDPENDSISYLADLASGDPLPNWLLFDTTARRFVGRAPNDAVGTWTVRVTATDSGQPSRSSETSFQIVIIADPTPWHNHKNPYDVDDNGRVAPLDALLIINALNSNEGGPLPTPLAKPLNPARYVDVSADNRLSPLDAILAINFLNDSPSGEGEASLLENSNAASFAMVSSVPSEYAPSTQSRPQDRDSNAYTSGTESQSARHQRILDEIYADQSEVESLGVMPSLNRMLRSRIRR